MYTKLNSELETQNDWAKDIKGEPLHISNAASGLKGYYCLGCDKEMQAVKRKNDNYQSYFRHHALDINKQNDECTFSSREYRERIAEQILHIRKELIVPPVYKYPPNGTQGIPIELIEKTTIQAASVKSQLSFYENENGEIKWGKNPEIDERYLLIRPDITFFDKTEKPILFVEFVITHKIPEEKKVILKRIGINTVQIIIPRVSEEAIEKSLKSVTKIKWVYNEIESNTDYIPVFEGNSEGIPSIDEEQRKLFEESYACRAAQIGNLIRSISRSLGSESYKRVEFQFEQEISRIEEASKRIQSRLDRIQGEIQEAIHSELGSRRESLEAKRSDLEGRYLDKIRDIESEENQFNEEEREFTREEEQFEFDDREFEESFGDISGIRNKSIAFSNASGRIQKEINAIESQIKK